MDKTGTVTNGKPEVTDILAFEGVDKNRVLQLLASLERQSEHPIAHAITTFAASKNILEAGVEAFDNIPGKGLSGIVDGVRYFAGNPGLIQEIGIVFDISTIQDRIRSGTTPVLLSSETRLLGIVFVSDTLKAGAPESVRQLHSL